MIITTLLKKEGNYFVINQSFKKLINFIQKNLYGKQVMGTLNSIGSNIFLDIGDDIKIPQKDRYRKEWVFWISWSSWRITKNGLYVVGSGDLRQDIQLGINYLMDKQVKNVCFTSSYLDLQIEFDDGYMLRTFFDILEEEQWTIFMPDGDNFSLDFSTSENVKEIQLHYSEYTQNHPIYNLKFEEKSTINNIFMNEDENLSVLLENGHTLEFLCNTWRLEVNNNYAIGFRDDNYLLIADYLKNKKLFDIKIENEFMDSEITLDAGYVIRTFACCGLEHQWSIRDRNPTFNANIQLADL